MTPGSSFPSRSSSIAPPPVETWKNLSSAESKSCHCIKRISSPKNHFCTTFHHCFGKCFCACFKGDTSESPTGPFQRTVLLNGFFRKISFGFRFQYQISFLPKSVRAQNTDERCSLLPYLLPQQHQWGAKQNRDFSLPDREFLLPYQFLFFIEILAH